MIIVIVIVDVIQRQQVVLLMLIALVIHHVNITRIVTVIVTELPGRLSQLHRPIRLMVRIRPFIVSVCSCFNLWLLRYIGAHCKVCTYEVELDICNMR